MRFTHPIKPAGTSDTSRLTGWWFLPIQSALSRKTQANGLPLN